MLLLREQMNDCASAIVAKARHRDLRARQGVRELRRGRSEGLNLSVGPVSYPQGVVGRAPARARTAHVDLQQSVPEGFEPSTIGVSIGPQIALRLKCVREFEGVHLAGVRIARGRMSARVSFGVADSCE